MNVEWKRKRDETRKEKRKVRRPSDSYLYTLAADGCCCCCWVNTHCYYSSRWNVTCEHPSSTQAMHQPWIITSNTNVNKGYKWYPVSACVLVFFNAFSSLSHPSERDLCPFYPSFSSTLALLMHLPTRFTGRGGVKWMRRLWSRRNAIQSRWTVDLYSPFAGQCFCRCRWYFHSSFIT